MSFPSYPFHSLSLKVSNKGMDFPFLPLKLSNKEIEEFSKSILFIHFHSISFPNFPQKKKKKNSFLPPKQWLKLSNVGVFLNQRKVYFGQGKVLK